jgi:formylglycine-generating enzyme required for sulfatase activity
MYNSPKHNVERDSTGNLIREYDTSNSRTTLINDEVRVYKGGSWRDVTYWLAPGTRRFMHQESSTNHIGFRCAMVSIGARGK